MGTGARAQRPKEAEAAMRRGAHLKQTVAASYIDAHGEKYTDDALAQRAGVSVNTVRNLWRGRNAEVSTLIGVATASGMSVLDLLVAMQGEATPPEVSASSVAAAIDRQTAMLREVLERMAPLESRPSVDEAVLVEQAEAARDRRVSDTPRPASRPADGGE